MEKNNEVATTQQQYTIQVFSSKEDFETGQRMAQVFAQSTLVPQIYQKNVGNCLIGLNMAFRMQADPLMVFQNLVVVSGVPSFEAKFAIACFNATGKYTPIDYQEIGTKGTDSYGMFATTINKTTGALVKGPEVTIQTAKDEGWYARNPKWKNIPQLMLRYRSASWLIRTVDPGCIMGLHTKEEVEDTEYTEVIADNVEQPSVEEQLSQAQEKEKQEANTQVVGMNVDDAPTSAPTAEPKQEAKEKKTVSKTQPLGKQEMPDMFKQ